MVKTLLAKHQIPAIVIEPATVFLQAGRQTASSIVDSLLLRASLQKSAAVAVVFERCDELLPMGSEDEHLMWLLSQWIGHQRHARGGSRDNHILCYGSINYVATTNRPLDQLHGLWVAAFADSCHITIQPELFSLAERRLLLKNVFLAEANLDLDSEAAQYTGGFLPCELHLLARKLAHHPSHVDVHSVAAEIRDEMLTMGRISRQEVEPASWDDVYGQMEAKEELISLSQLLMDPSHRRLYVDRGLEWPRGVLLYGPPGTGKTKLARVMAHGCQAHFMALSLSELVHAEVGASEAALREAFATARRLQPAVIFLDELDALVPDNQQESAQSVSAKLMIQLCEEMDELERKGADCNGLGRPGDLVLVLGATNLLDSLPVTLLQYSRFGKQIYVGPLTAQEQAHMISGELSKIKIDVSTEEVIPYLVGSNRTGAQVTQLLDRFKVELLSANTHQNFANAFLDFIKDAD